MPGRIGLDRTARRPAGVLGAAIVLTLGGGVWTAVVRVNHGSGPDVVVSAQDATVGSGAATRLAVRGDRLALGDVLVTGPAGRASVDVPDGRLELGPSSAVRVTALRQAELLHGVAGLRLRRGGATLTLETGTVTASVSVDGAAVRVARDYRVSVAALAGGAEINGVDGSSLDLPALSEADVPGIVLPAAAIPVQSLDHDANGVDVALAPGLVRDDVDLDHIAAQVDADSVARTALRPASFELNALPASTTHPSEIALTRAIGQASRGDHGDAMRRAVALRSAGAAWAIVAAELGVAPDQLRPIIDQMLAAPTLRALVPVVATEALSPASPGSATSSATGSSVPAITQPAPRPASPPSIGRPGAPAPAGSPPTSAPSTNPVGALVATVTGLLGASPHPTPPPSPGGGSGLLCSVVGLIGLC